MVDFPAIQDGKSILQSATKLMHTIINVDAPEVWGVAYDEATGLIYPSDMNSGLWILRRTDQ